MKKRRINKHYNIKPLLALNCQYNLLIGERTNGKSFAVKKTVLEDVLQKGHFFCYVRRWKTELKAYEVENYFQDFVLDYDEEGKEVRRISDMTNGEYTDILAITGKIYFATLDEWGKKVKGIQIGYYFSLASQGSYKSQSFPQAYNLVFEEFITTEGYLPNEPKLFLHLISTIFRTRTGRIFLIGNTINRTFPYIKDWGLDNILHQPRGTIEVYKVTDGETEIKIGVEITKNDLRNNRLAFGRNVNSITNGEWETDQYLHLDQPYNSYEILYVMYAIYQYMKFRISVLRDNDEIYLYIDNYEYDIPEDARVVTNTYNCGIMYTRTFSEVLTIYDRKILRLLKMGKVKFENDLVGTDFTSAFNIK